MPSFWARPHYLPSKARRSTECLFDKALSQSVECFFIDSQLLQNPMEQRRPDLVSAMDRNCGGATIRVAPSFVTAFLANPLKAEFGSCPSKLVRPSARHERFQCCPAAGSFQPRGTPPRSSRKHPQAPPVPPQPSASARGTRESQESPPPTLRVGFDTTRLYSRQTPSTAILALNPAIRAIPTPKESAISDSHTIPLPARRDNLASRDRACFSSLRLGFVSHYRKTGGGGAAPPFQSGSAGGIMNALVAGL
jgi:hypothetical protein